MDPASEGAAEVDGASDSPLSEHGIGLVSTSVSLSCGPPGNGGGSVLLVHAATGWDSDTSGVADSRPGGSTTGLTWSRYGFGIPGASSAAPGLFETDAGKIKGGLVSFLSRGTGMLKAVGNSVRCSSWEESG